jgi:hypothetical protein
MVRDFQDIRVPDAAEEIGLRLALDIARQKNHPPAEQHAKDDRAVVLGGALECARSEQCANVDRTESRAFAIADEVNRNLPGRGVFEQTLRAFAGESSRRDP